MKVLVSDSLSPEGVEILKKQAEVTEQHYENQEDLIKAIPEYEALVVRSATKVTAEVIAAGKKLKVIGRAGVGVDNIDIQAATERGIMVINAPEGNTISAAEHAIAMLTSLARNISAANVSMKKGEWKRSIFQGVELYRKTLGVIGIGRIGSEVARRVRGMGMTVLAYDPYIAPEQAEKSGVELVELDTLLREADFITLHMPRNASTYHILGAAEFKKMKQGVRIINCARGGLIDEAALCDAISSGQVAGAGLDVFEEEPPTSCPLISMDSVIVTPHLGASTHEAQVNVAVQVAEQIVKALKGEPVVYAVNVPVVMPEVLQEVKPFLPLMRLLGNLYMEMFGGAVEEIEIQYSGEIAAKPVSPLTTSCLIGFLQVMVGGQVNYVNAPKLAEGRGIKVREVLSGNSENFTNMIVVKVKSGDKVNTIGGTIFNHNDMRIVLIGEYSIEVVPSKYMLVCTYLDRPGIIGKVATVLGSENINIGSMQVGRRAAGGDAMMVLQVDDPVPAALLQQIKDMELVSGIHFVELRSNGIKA